jgi:hypothetical protein
MFCLFISIFSKFVKRRSTRFSIPHRASFCVVDWRVRENSNQIFSFSGLNLHIASSVIAM